jgi:hypothetical protein
MYLPRWNVPPDTDAGKGGMLDGLLCFGTAKCDACAWDLKDPDKPTMAKPWSMLQLQPPTGPAPNCSGCHGPGPVLPKHDLWKSAKKALQDANDTCTEKGGPNWLCGSTNPDWSTPNPNDVIYAGKLDGGLDHAADGGPGCFNCHSGGFVPTPTPPGNPNYCAIIRTAMEPGGSMGGAGIQFPSVQSCIDFMTAMKCTSPDPSTFCMGVSAK